MRALVYHGPGQKAWEEVPDPEITDDGDAIVRVDAITICGTDLHILKGDVPAVAKGRILGHEAVGTVEEAGDGVRRFAPATGSSSPASARAGPAGSAARAATGSAWTGGGWILGHKIDGTQAEYVRVPFADTSTYPVPDGVTDEEILMLADILPTGYEVGVLNGNVRPGDVVAVVGAGPIGLSAITGARLFSPSHIVAIDLADARLEAAKQFGADVTVNNSREDPLDRDQGADRAAWARTWRSRPSASPPPSSWPSSWPGPAAGSPTSACTASPRRCTWKSSGSGTSRSPRAWWTPTPPRP